MRKADRATASLVYTVWVLFFSVVILALIGTFAIISVNKNTKALEDQTNRVTGLQKEVSLLRKAINGGHF